MVRFGLGMNFRFLQFKINVRYLIPISLTLISQIMLLFPHYLPTRQLDAVGATWIDA